MFHFFKTLFPCASFSRIDQTDLKELSARVFFKNRDIRGVELRRNIHRTCFCKFIELV